MRLSRRNGRAILVKGRLAAWLLEENRSRYETRTRWPMRHGYKLKRLNQPFSAPRRTDGVEGLEMIGTRRAL